MHRRPGWRGTVALVLALLTAGCHHRAGYYEDPPLDGLRFHARVEQVGTAGDSVRIIVSARNTARVSRTLERGICGDDVIARVYRMSASGPQSGADPVWDQAVWHRATDPPHQVCLAGAIAQLLTPGDSAAVGALVLPSRIVLGDSLPAGRYRVTARLNGSGWRAGEIEAGQADLHPPPT